MAGEPVEGQGKARGPSITQGDGARPTLAENVRITGNLRPLADSLAA